MLAGAVLAVLTVVATVTVAGDPAGSAERRDHREQTQKQKQKQHQERERSSRRFRGGQGAANGRPAQFVAERDGRIVVVSVETGRIDRYLTADRPGGGAEEPALSADSRTVWFSRGDGTCAAHLASVPLAGGREEKLPGSGEAGHEGTPLPRPGHSHIAYTRTDCEDLSRALIVSDLAGLEGHGQMGLAPLAWSRDGSVLLAAAEGVETRLLKISESGAIVDNRRLELVDTTRECRLEVVGFSPDENNGFVALRRCGSGESTRRSMVLLDQDGNARKTVLRLPRGEDFIDRPAFDPTGHSLLFSTAPAQLDDAATSSDTGISLWLWRDGETRVLARQSGYRHPSWLP